jgi:hypothetical protein
MTSSVLVLQQHNMASMSCLLLAALSFDTLFS